MKSDPDQEADFTSAAPAVTVQKVAAALRGNHVETQVVDTGEEARRVVLGKGRNEPLRNRLALATLLLPNGQGNQGQAEERRRASVAKRHPF